MSDVLFIKTSSLGDVIHHMPALTEARAHRPEVRFGWVVEEAFAPLVRLHPGVNEVIPVAMRRWRGLRLLSPATWGAIARFRRVLRARIYDAVIDTQGLLKSALLARAARRAAGTDTIRTASRSRLPARSTTCGTRSNGTSTPSRAIAR